MVNNDIYAKANVPNSHCLHALANHPIKIVIIIYFYTIDLSALAISML